MICWYSYILFNSSMCWNNYFIINCPYCWNVLFWSKTFRRNYFSNKFFL